MYMIDTLYNADRDATEVSFGYIEKEEQVKGRIMSLRVIVNVPGHKNDKKARSTRGSVKARELITRAAEAPFEAD